MDKYNYFAFFIFSFVASVTPGPANIAVFSQSSISNWRKTIPFMTGITIGFAAVLYSGALIYLSGVQAGAAMLPLKVIGSIYLLWIGYQITTSSSDIKANAAGFSVSFLKGILIHPLSYKAWLFVILSYSSFASGDYKQNIFMLSVIFLLSSIVSMIPWIILGHIAGQFLSKEKVAVINKTSGWTLIGLVAYIWVV